LFVAQENLRGRAVVRAPDMPTRQIEQVRNELGEDKIVLDVEDGGLNHDLSPRDAQAAGIYVYEHESCFAKMARVQGLKIRDGRMRSSPQPQASDEHRR
jgi:hypothetical protein